MSDAAGKFDVRAYSKLSNSEVYFFCEECYDKTEEWVNPNNLKDVQFQLIEEYEEEDTFEFIGYYTCDDCGQEQRLKDDRREATT